MQAAIFLTLVLCSAPPERASEKLGGELSCKNCSPTATLDKTALTTGTSDGKLTVQMDYTWSDDIDWLDKVGSDPDYTHKLELSSGGTKDWKHVQDTNNGNGSGTLQITLNNGQWYKKTYSVQIYAYAADTTPGYSCSKQASDSLDLTLKNESYSFDTKVSVGSPGYGVYKWSNVTVSGTATVEPPAPGTNWEIVKKGTKITLTAQNGAWGGTATCQTNKDGRWSQVFSKPAKGWDEDFPWYCKAELASGQETSYGANTAYKYSFDQKSASVYTSKDMLKQAVQDIWDNKTVQLYNPLQDVQLSVLVTGFDPSGASLATGGLAIDPQTTTVIDLGFYTGGAGSAELAWCGPRSGFSLGQKGALTTGAGGFSSSLDGLTTLWGPIQGGEWASDVAVKVDPPPYPVDVQVTVYGLDGSNLGQTVFALDPHAVVSLRLPDDIPGLPPEGRGTVHVTALGGEDTLCGAVRRENLLTGAVSSDDLLPGGWPKLSAPLVEQSPTRSTGLFVHNPADEPAEALLNFFEESGALYASEAGIVLAPHGGVLLEAAAYVGADWRGSAEIELLAGEGVSGTVLYEEGAGAETASMPMVGEPARLIVLPIVGEGIDWDGLYCVHNPGDEVVTGQAVCRNADGSVGTEEELVIGAHATVVLDSNLLEPAWAEPWATFDFRVTSAAGAVVGGALLRDPGGSGTVAAACSAVPGVARAEAPLWQAGWNLVSIPADPLDSAVEVVLALPAQTSDLANNLLGYTQQDGYGLYPLNLCELHRGQAYWLYLETPSGCEFPCAGGGGDFFSILLDEGWTLWGYPFVEAQPWDDCRITDGVDTLDPAAAEAAGWIQRSLYGYDDGYYAVPGEEALVEPWRGYWLLAHRDGLTLEIPSP